MQQVLAGKNVQKTKFEAAEMILDHWKQQFNQDLTSGATGSKFIKGVGILCVVFATFLEFSSRDISNIDE